MPTANANPDKRFFIDLIIRDISLEDAILDLIDNSIDSLVRTKQINFYKDLLNTEGKNQDQSLAEIKINISSRQFTVEDNCGGIPFDSAENEVFRFGHPDPHRGASLSVFGIGMKRAIFKIGRQFEIESHAADNGFLMRLNADEWMMDEQATDWKIPLVKKGGEKDPSKAGTKIIITQLREEVSAITENPSFHNRLIKTIQETYPFYLGKYISIFMNGKEITSLDLSFGVSQGMKPSIETWKDGNVKATLICGLLPRKDSQWTTEKSGWYLLCNGRVIVYADKTRLTGWGSSLPQFMPKNRGFLGIIFFQSEHPEDLPWNTTKRGINSESAVYVRTLKRMISSAKLIIQFQNKLYEHSDEDKPREEYKASVNELQPSSATKQAAETILSEKHSDPQSFFFKLPEAPPKFANIQFKVKPEDLSRVKKRLGKSNMPNYEVGERIFKYYIDRECPQ